MDRLVHHLRCTHPTLETNILAEKKGMQLRNKKSVYQGFCVGFVGFVFPSLAWNLLVFMHIQKLFFTISYVLSKGEHVMSQNHVPSQMHLLFKNTANRYNRFFNACEGKDKVPIA